MLEIPPLPPSPFDKPPPIDLPITQAEKFRLSLLSEATRARAIRVMQRMMSRGYACPYVGSTRRTPREQEEAVKRGTSSASQTLSWHLLDRAVDFRKRLADDQPDKTTNDYAFFLALWESAEEETDFRCLGFKRDHAGHPIKNYINGGKLWDPGHCEYRHPYDTLAQATMTERPELLT